MKNGEIFGDTSDNGKAYDMSDAPSWSEIAKQREERKKLGIDLHVFWTNDSQLSVGIDGKSELLTPEELVKKYGDRSDLMNEYRYLMSANSELEGSTRASMEHDFLEESLNNDGVSQEVVDISDIRSLNEKKLSEIVDELGLHESEEPLEQLRQCIDIHKYITIHNKYNNAVMVEKEGYSPEEMVDRDLYNALVKNSGVCTSNSIEMRALFDKVGIKSECVGLISRGTGGMHMAVIAELMGDYYFFDPTLERTIFIENRGEGARPEDLIVCCAGLGQDEYMPYYEPNCIVSRDMTTAKLPTNISNSSIPKMIINS